MRSGHDNKRYKNELLDLMRRIDKVLSKEGIQYFAVYGTCLGAVRELGIIPWDDDIDIAVWRDDFSRTLKVLSESSEQIYAGDRSIIPGCPSRCGRIFNRVSSSSTIERRRAYIDLHVIDYAPRSKFWFLWLVFWYVGISRIVSRRNGCVGRHHKLLYALADCLAFPFRMFPSSLLNRLADWLYIYKKPSPFVKITFDGNRKRYSSTVFANSERVTFNDFNIPVPIGYNAYLTQCYGDWRTPPPLDARFSHAFDRDGITWSVECPKDEDRGLIK